MFHGVITLMARSLRLEARLLRTHLFRLVFVFFIYLMMLMAQMQSMFIGAPGLMFFSSMLFLNVAFIAAGGVSFFASAITEEKEENTLGLLMMTGLSPVGILFGKSTARMIQALLLLTVQLPFTLLAVTLGGVLTNQVLAAYASMLAFIVLLSNLSLLWSVVCKRTGSAAGVTAVCVLAYGIAPFFTQELLKVLPRQPWIGTPWGAAVKSLVQGINDASVFHRLGDIVSTGFADPPIGSQVISNVVAGAVCFLLSWALFGRFALNADSFGMTRIALPRWSARSRRLAAGRAWFNPLIWKDYHFLTGGNVLMIAKFAALAALGPIIFLSYHYGSTYSSANGDVWTDTIRTHMGVAAAVFGLEASVYASRIFHDEIREQTMVGLLTLPRSIEYVAYSKVAGCGLALIPSVMFVLIDACLLPEGPGSIYRALKFPGFWAGVLVASVFLHLVVLLSLFVKWGALPLAFVMTLMCMYCCPVWIVFAMGGVGDDDWAASLVGIVILWVLWGVSCFVFQMMIHARLYELGSK
jgi:hypothetical protein